MLERLFTSKTRVKILKLLLFTEDEVHLREIARRTGVSAAYIGKELEKLEGLNLVKKNKKGNLYLFSINRASPIFEDLKRIFLKTESLGDYLKESLGEKFEKVRYALIYGSFAEGKETGESDVDLLIVGDINEEELIKSIKSMEDELEREINYILWSEEEFKERADQKHHLLVEIIKRPVIGILGDMNEFRGVIKEKNY